MPPTLAPHEPQVKKSIESFASALKQDGSAPEITDMVMKALAEKAVVMEGGKPAEGFKVRRIPAWSEVKVWQATHAVQESLALSTVLFFFWHSSQPACPHNLVLPGELNTYAIFVVHCV